MARFHTLLHSIASERRLHSIKQLRSVHTIVAFVHLAFVFMFLQLDMSQDLPVVSFNSSFTETTDLTVQATRLASVDILDVVATYLVLAAIGHFLTATLLWKRYVRYLTEHRNPMRWVEYSISCSLMLVALALANGISALSVLIMIFALGAAMNLTGLLFENINRRLKGIDWSPFLLGCLLGIAPWLVMLLHNAMYGSAFVSNSTATLYFVLFIYMLFPLNMYLSARQVGPWRSYVGTEIGYIALSLFAKTSLAVILYFNLV